MTQLSEIQGSHTLRARVPAEGTAGNDDTWVLGFVPKCTITGAKFIPDAAVTGAATNNFILTVQNKAGDGTGSTAVTQSKTYASGTNSVAAAPETLSLSATAANLDCALNDVLALVRTHNGTGLASVAGIVEITYKLR